MRHKTFLINPEIIKQKGINIYRCIQKPGEFVITFGGCYHEGFNMGFNCAEAVNFATKNWIDIGLKAKFCKCQKDSVQIEMEKFCKNLVEKKLIKKKEYEEYVKVIQENRVLEGDFKNNFGKQKIEINFLGGEFVDNFNHVGNMSKKGFGKRKVFGGASLRERMKNVVVRDKKKKNKIVKNDNNDKLKSKNKIFENFLVKNFIKI
jgi:hypothetical protein